MAEEALDDLRAKAYAYLSATSSVAVHGGWRTVVTDSESLTGFGPVCTREDHPDGMDDGVYDCCPQTTETFSVPMAAYLVALLNEDGKGRNDG